MAVLSCEICGGKLIGKPGGIFECDSCGMEYSTEWAKAKVQEIKGTVKVEGTVEVQGTVKVDGPVKVEGNANLQSLLKRAWMQIETPKSKEDLEFKATIDKLMDIDATCAEIYVLRLLRGAGMKSLEDLKQSGHPLENDENWKKALQYADSTYKAQLEAVAQQQAQYIAYWADTLRDRRKLVNPVQDLVLAPGGHVAALKSDGTVLIHEGYCDEWLEPAREWSGITAIAGDQNVLIGLKVDGSCVSVKDREGDYMPEVAGWTGVHKMIAIRYGSRSPFTYQICGLRDNGELLFSDNDVQEKLYRNDVVDFYIHKGEYRPKFEVTTRDGSVYKYEHSSWEKKKHGSAERLGGKYDFIAAPGVLKNGHCGVVSYADNDYFKYYWLKADGQIYQGEKAAYGTPVKLDLPAAAAMIAQGGLVSHEQIVLHDDGTITYMTERNNDDFDFSEWKLFDAVETFEQKRADAETAWLAEEEVRQRAAAERRAAEEEERQRKLAAIEAERAALEVELSKLRGPFCGKRRKEIEARLSQLELMKRYA